MMEKTARCRAVGSVRSMDIYEHSQTGTGVIGLLGAGLLFTGGVMGSRGPDATLVVVFFVLAVCLFLFCRLMVRVGADCLEVRLHGGIRVRRVFLRDITSHRPITYPWFYGWGIRLVPGGWLIGVSGRQAVEIVQSDHRRLLVGTDEPDVLDAALSRACRGEDGS